MSRWGLAGLLVLAACGGGNPVERGGDRAWHEGRWVDAMTAYQSAGESPRLLAKYADAALRGGFLPEAVQGWTRLAQADGDRAKEAATGLARTALAAEHNGNQPVLALALAGLRRVAPDWPGGRLVRHLDGARGLNPDQAAAVWLMAIASETDRETAGRALVGFGEAAAAQGDCPAAIGVFRSAVRRIEADARDSVLTAMATCELQLGLTALARSQDDAAEGWFDRVVEHDPSGPRGRRALVGLGDARMRQGDVASAILAWRAVVTATVPPDSIFVLAIERLQAATSALPDSSQFVPGWL